GKDLRQRRRSSSVGVVLAKFHQLRTTLRGRHKIICRHQPRARRLSQDERTQQLQLHRNQFLLLRRGQTARSRRNGITTLRRGDGCTCGAEAKLRREKKISAGNTRPPSSGKIIPPLSGMPRRTNSRDSLKRREFIRPSTRVRPESCRIRSTT